MSTLRDALLEAGAWCVTAPPGQPSPLDYALVGVALALVLYAFSKCVRHTLRPGERDRSHVKWSVIDDEDRG